MTTTTAPSLDIRALSDAIEGRDADGQVGAYLPDAELVVVDHLHPPSRPLVISGTEALREYFQDVCARDMTHHVATAALAADTLTLEVSCRYPDGTKVLCLSVAGVRDGRIAWQRLVQAWDS